MFQQQQNSVENKKNCCYPLLVSTTTPQSSTATTTPFNSCKSNVGGGGDTSSSSSSTFDGKHANGSMKSSIITPPPMLQHFGTIDHSFNSNTSTFGSGSGGGGSASIRVHQSPPFTNPFHSVDTISIPRPIATLEKSPNFREFNSGGGGRGSASSGISMTGFNSNNTGPSIMRNVGIPQSSSSSGGPSSMMIQQQPPQPSLSINTSVLSSSSNNNNNNTEYLGPKLHFCKKQLKEQTCAELHSEPEFRLNDKTKHPPNTLFNVSIKDVLTVTGYYLNDCEMFLRLDNGSQHGSPVGSCFFKPINSAPNSLIMGNDIPNRLFRAKIDIPPSLNTKKGNTSSRVGFVEIHDSNNKMIAVSDKFWIRSRSRNQMVKDESTKKRIRMNQKQTDSRSSHQKQHKQVFHDYSPTSPQQDDDESPLNTNNNSSYYNPTNMMNNQIHHHDQIEPPTKKVSSSLFANPHSGAPAAAASSSSSASAAIVPPLMNSSSGSSGFSSILHAANDQSSSPNLEFWNSRNLLAADQQLNSLSNGPSFSFLDKDMSNASGSSNSRAPTTSNLLLNPSSWNYQGGGASGGVVEPLKTLENLVRNQQQRIEELSCLIANNAKLIHTLQMHVLSLANPINSEP